ncbi:hypothetical protein O181_021897 [Austropuccinia psidii MF-1]|uniref:Uncharacterized protein n=1 Tax=Austropuccinia psidii MF-1 TaxID=1389203 RepID=A0A9Q3CEG8_9BASI|nr:hypothetical protein [Austropuccinia psidii MF-1]
MEFKFQKPNPPNPPQQDTHKQTPQQPTPGPSGIQWSEDLSRKPSQQDEPPISGPSPSSKPPEDIPTREQEPEVVPMQSTEEPFAHPATPCSVIFIDNTPIQTPPSPTPPPSQCQDPLIPTMKLAINSLTSGQL